MFDDFDFSRTRFLSDASVDCCAAIVCAAPHANLRLAAQSGTKLD